MMYSRTYNIIFPSATPAPTVICIHTYIYIYTDSIIPHQKHSYVHIQIFCMLNIYFTFLSQQRRLRPQNDRLYAEMRFFHRRIYPTAFYCQVCIYSHFYVFLFTCSSTCTHVYVDIYVMRSFYIGI